MSDEDDAPSPDEVQQRWLRPPEVILALERLGHPQVGVREVLRRAKAGLLRAAGECSWVVAGKDRYSSCSVVPKSWWERAIQVDQYHNDFWRTGGVTFNVRIEGGYTTSRQYEFFDVRFEPDGIEIIPGADLSAIGSVNTRAGGRRHATLPAEESPRPGSTLSPSEFDDWLRGQPQQVRDQGYMKLWALAQAAHPDRRVPRKLAEGVARGRKTGRKRTSENAP